MGGLNTHGGVGGKGNRAPALGRTCLWSSWPRVSSSERLTGIETGFAERHGGRRGEVVQILRKEMREGHLEAHE